MDGALAACIRPLKRCGQTPYLMWWQQQQQAALRESVVTSSIQTPIQETELQQEEEGNPSK
jgi:hypothetical protein